MLTQGGFQAWLADEDGFEIANEAPSYNGYNDTGAVVPIDAAKKYVVHWKALPRSARESWWCQVATFSSGEKNPRCYHKRATHWMDEADRKTHLRSSNRLIGKAKDTGLLSPEVHSPKQGVRLALRRAKIDQKTNTVDQDGYANPEFVLLRNKFTPPDVAFRFYFDVKATIVNRPTMHANMLTRATKRLSDASPSLGYQLTTPELSERSSKRRKLATSASTVAESPQREDTESRLSSPLTSDDDRGDTPINPSFDLHDCKIKVEKSVQDLQKVSDENERLKEFERTLLEIEKNKAEIKRIEAKNEARRAQIIRLSKAAGIKVHM